MGTLPIDPSKLRETGQAMHQPAQQLQEALRGVSAQDVKSLPTAQREELFDNIRQPIQDATAILKLGGELGAPDVPGSFMSGQKSRTQR